MHPRDLSPSGWYNVCDTHTSPIALKGEFTGIHRGKETIDSILKHRAAVRRSGPPEEDAKQTAPATPKSALNTLELDGNHRLVTPVVLNTASRKLHIAEPDEQPHYHTLGCTWGFGGHLAAESIWSADELALYTVIKCKTCFRNHQLPSGWLTAITPVQSDCSDLSSGGSSNDEDTESDNEPSSEKRQRRGGSQTHDGRSSA